MDDHDRIATLRDAILDAINRVTSGDLWSRDSEDFYTVNVPKSAVDEWRNAVKTKKSK